MTSIFSKIINKELPAHIIYEDSKFIAFLDAFPLTKGHVLVVPKKEIDKLFDLDKKTYADLMSLCYTIAQSLEKCIPCLRVGMCVIGLEVPHVHVHLIPINTMEDMNFSKPKIHFTNDEFQKICALIRSQINQI